MAMLTDFQGILMRGTPLESSSVMLRDLQVVIGVRDGVAMTAPAIHAARFVPSPPGANLEADLRSPTDWMNLDHGALIDPAAMAHYQFETLHPFRGGNGRTGRLLIVLHLMKQQVLSEPSLTVSPWFEARRGAYYDRLLAVSTHGDWDGFVSFFATGLAAVNRLYDVLALPVPYKDDLAARTNDAGFGVVAGTAILGDPVGGRTERSARLGEVDARAEPVGVA